MHRRVYCRLGVPLRGFPDIHGLAGRSAHPPSFLRVSRPAALLGFPYPSQVCSRGRVAGYFCPAGPTCRFARRASAPIDFRRGDRSPSLGVQRRKAIDRGLYLGVAFDFWALTPICDPRPPAREPGDRSCLGLCLLQGLRARICARESGSTPTPITGLRNPRAPGSSRSSRIPIRSWVCGSVRTTRTQPVPSAYSWGRCLAGLNSFEGRFGPTPCLRFCTVREREMTATS
jgi:hypothetical protein